MIIVFAGPTISAAEIVTELNATVLPPVSQGDVYRCALRRPKIIGIIDGYFDRVPAVWHKEILWAMSEGIHVFGASSIGALRAAELAAFGMRGVGKIFEAFRGGHLEADDEVALTHAPAEFAYKPFSEALVNIRATVNRAADQQIISGSARDDLIAAAKRLYYPERTYRRIIDDVQGSVSQVECRRFTEWVALHRVDQKAEDARQMLREIRAFADSDPEPNKVVFSFEQTALWSELARTARHGNVLMSGVAEPQDEELDEERRTALLFRILAVDEAYRYGYQITEEALAEAITAFRRQRALLDEASLALWLERRGIAIPDFLRHVGEDVRAAWVSTLLQDEVMRRRDSYLRLTSRGD